MDKGRLLRASMYMIQDPFIWNNYLFSRMLAVEEKGNMILTAIQSDRHHFHLCVVDKENHKAIADLIRKNHF